MQAGVKTSQTHISACSTPNKNHMFQFWFLKFSLSHTPASLSPPRPHATGSPQPLTLGKKSSSIQKHMWLAIKLHMHSAYPNLHPPTPRPQSPPSAPPADAHIDLQGGEKSYIRGDVKTMGRGGSVIRQQSELSVAGSKDKGVWGRGGVVRQWRQSARR